ncbi:MAG: peptidylprolyl isomerase [Bacteroidales bacterium]|jgi:FKBP-type peptidyl-prolyl cis-trans isomerase SlyD|nr:peptidylprolyl isomerase [Bacteroidales bacterium]
MKVENNKVVSLSYTLTVADKVFETVTAEKPLQFIFGTGMLLPKFEANVSGKDIGDEFEFELPAADAYGEVNPQAIVELPMNIFEVDGKIDENVIKVGETLPMRDSEGNQLSGKITEMKDNSLMMDFNHPLAGSDLHFKGKVEQVRDASQEELTNGLFGEKLQHECCGGCGGDECCGEGGGCGEGSGCCGE